MKTFAEWPRARRWLAEAVMVSLIAAVFVVALDFTTNSLDISRYTWDWFHYLDMAEHGVAGNPGLVAPYAYRPIPPLLAGALADLTGRTVFPAFRAIAWLGLGGQLVLSYALARQFTSRLWGALGILLIAGFSTFNVRYYVFDPFRPDPLAFPLLLLGLIGLVRRRENRWWDAVIIGTAVVGSGIREFTVIPILLLAARLAAETARKRRWQDAAELVLTLLIAAAALLAPRLLIPVGRDDSMLARVDGGLLGVITDWPRNLNIVFSLLIALLPVLVLLTPARARRLWAVLRPLHLELGLYALIVAGLTFLGGSDLLRFTAYGVGLVVILLAVLVEDGLHGLELAYALVAVFVFYRTWQPVPMESLDAFLNWNITYRLNSGTTLRMAEWLLWVLGGVGVRRIIRWLEPERVP